ncbi:MAG: hypothetical protein JXR70_02215 [Spirochaetales bacterium]|nr:hypothetical protein [Spirochaetales bacterium]
MFKNIFVISLALIFLITFTACPGLSTSTDEKDTQVESPIFEKYCYATMMYLETKIMIPDSDSTISVTSEDNTKTTSFNNTIASQTNKNILVSGTMTEISYTDSIKKTKIYDLKFTNDPILNTIESQHEYIMVNGKNTGSGSLIINGQSFPVQNMYDFINDLISQYMPYNQVHSFAYNLLTDLERREFLPVDQKITVNHEGSTTTITFVNAVTNQYDVEATQAMAALVNGTIVNTSGDCNLSGTKTMNLQFVNNTMLSTITADFNYDCTDEIASASGSITINGEELDAQEYIEISNPNWDDPDMTSELYAYHRIYNFFLSNYSSDPNYVINDEGDIETKTYTNYHFSSINAYKTVSGTFITTSSDFNYSGNIVIDLEFCGERYYQTLSANFNFVTGENGYQKTGTGTITINGIDYPAENYFSYIYPEL